MLAASEFTTEYTVSVSFSIPGVRRASTSLEKSTKAAPSRLKKIARTSVEGGRARLLSRRRSEEHTSELQSRLHLVCRLLLEKKKKTTYTFVGPLSISSH